MEQEAPHLDIGSFLCRVGLDRTIWRFFSASGYRKTHSCDTQGSGEVWRYAVVCPGRNSSPIFNVSELEMQSCSLCGLGVAEAPDPVRVGTHAPLPRSLGLISAPRTYCYGNEPGKLFEPIRKRGTFIKEKTNQGHSVKSGKNQRREA